LLPNREELVDPRKLPLQRCDGVRCGIDMLGVDDPAALIRTALIAPKV
jgi:hypothetical protein